MTTERIQRAKIREILRQLEVRLNGLYGPVQSAAVEQLPLPNNHAPFFKTDNQHNGPECMICLEAPANFGFLHKTLDDIHFGVCGKCAMEVPWATMGCPVCRQGVLRPVKIHFSN